MERFIEKPVQVKPEQNGGSNRALSGKVTDDLSNK